MVTELTKAVDHKQSLQDEEYEIPYHYRDLFAPGQEVERTMLFEGVFDLLQVNASSRILDFGCGDGRFCYFAKQRCEVIGCDVSEPATRWARAFNPGLKFITGPISPQEAGTFDGIASLEVIEHISDENLRTIVPLLHSLLKPGKRLVVTVPSVNVPLHEKHYKHYTEQLLIDLFGKHFEVVVHGSTVSKSFYHKPLKILNMISLLFYSPRFAQKHSGLVQSITRRKRNLWRRHLQWGAPSECNRLVAVCTKR